VGQGEDPMPNPRAEHAVVALNLGGADFVYVLGGQGSDGPSSVVMFFRLQEKQETDTPFVPGGWYTSRIYEIGLDDAQIEEITWDVSFPNTNMDIEMQYRGVNAAGCVSPDWSGSPWITLDETNGDVQPDPPGGKFSSEGRNTYIIPEVDGKRPVVSCFQYRARLETGATDFTPHLDRVGLKIFSPNSPDLNVVDISPVWENGQEGFLEDVDITIQNNYVTASERTLDANIENRPGYNFFYADMFVFGPGFDSTTPPDPADFILPYDNDETGAGLVGGGSVKPVLTAGNNEQCGLSKVALPALATMELEHWYTVQDDMCTKSSVVDLFDQTGTYYICIALDSFVETEDLTDWPLGYVTEDLNAVAEENNVTCTDGITILIVSMVTISRDPDTVLEGNSGTYTISRDNAPPTPLTIPFTLSGSATSGADYTLLDSEGQPVPLTGNTGEIVIPANETTVTLTLQTVDEGQLPREDKHETAILTLSNDDGDPQEYVFESQSSATIKIEDPNVLFEVRIPMMRR
jgi:hypothetical protein